MAIVYNMNEYLAARHTKTNVGYRTTVPNDDHVVLHGTDIVSSCVDITMHMMHSGVYDKGEIARAILLQLGRLKNQGSTWDIIL